MIIFFKAFQRIWFRPRVLINVKNIDMKTKVGCDTILNFVQSGSFACFHLILFAGSF